MKNQLKNKSKKLAIILLAGTLSFQSCATVFGGRVTECQRTKPAAGQPRRAIRPVALIADIFIGGIASLPIDFITGAIYKPCQSKATIHHEEKGK